MVIQGVELIMSRRQIKNMIETDPVDIVLRRYNKVPVPGGGWRFNLASTLQPQTIRLIPFKRRMSEFLANTELGHVSDLPYVLLGYHTMDLLKGDRFTLNNQEFVVETLDISEPEVKTAAHVDYFGGGINE